MAAVNKIDSNSTGLRYAVETSLGQLSGSDVWVPLEPNSYSDFGGELTLVARNPINRDRRRRKGVITDLDASGGFNTDFTLNLQELLQGAFFAQLRRKGEEAVTAVDVDSTNPDEYEVASTTGFLAGSLIFGSGFTNSANNGLKTVTAVTLNTSVEVADGSLVAETPPADAKIVVVGYQAVQGDIDVTSTGDFSTYTSTTLDFTTLGLEPGEFIFVGGDASGLRFSNAANNGFKRIRSISQNALVVDKSDATMVTEDNSATSNATIQFFFGRVLRDRTGTDIVRQTVQLERSLGAPDDGSTDEQYEYLVGAVLNEVAFNFPTADKATIDLTFIATDNEQRDATDGEKAGTRPDIGSERAFNTSSDFTVRPKMGIVSATSDIVTPLFGYITELTLNINNNASPNKAVGVLGAFDVTAGTFEVSAEITAYFSDIAAVEAVRNSSDVTLHWALVQANKGVAFDIPLIALGNGRLDVEQDEPITLPLDADAADGRDVDSDLNYTLQMVFFDYLPNLAH